ncbi:MAG: energy-coupling factor transporter transmembrane protein EcfT [Chloroflexi bacterium]|nr:energy-coupling factor transporter transmembrane protein EcfT [Chloroflexota bacterium]MBU1746152.1 energy-coupling factor transporter transmembrane protein EcfT [Chloroflexota bacterium]
MRGLRRGGRRQRAFRLRDDSPLRGIDPRVKLALSLLAASAVMLPLVQLAAFMLAYTAFLAWGRVLDEAIHAAARIAWLMAVLFVVDWLVIDLPFAVLITLRLILVVSAFAAFLGTTTLEELRLALAWLRVPYRYAFTLSLAVGSITVLDEEWRAVQEAQRARGAWRRPQGLRGLPDAVRDLVSLAVPTVVLTTRRAWSLTEAAYARGFDSPHRRPYDQLHLRWPDWVLFVSSLLLIALLILSR